VGANDGIIAVNGYGIAVIVIKGAVVVDKLWLLLPASAIPEEDIGRSLVAIIHIILPSANDGIIAVDVDRGAE
jgi:hypothetical protein